MVIIQGGCSTAEGLGEGEGRMLRPRLVGRVGFPKSEKSFAARR